MPLLRSAYLSSFCFFFLSSATVVFFPYKSCSYAQENQAYNFIAMNLRAKLRPGEMALEAKKDQFLAPILSTSQLPVTLAPETRGFMPPWALALTFTQAQTHVY